MIARALIVAAFAAVAFAQSPPPRSAAAPRPSSGARPAAPQSGAASPSKTFDRPAVRPPRLPSFAAFDLPNGIRLLLAEDHERPIVSGMALVRTGFVFDPPDRAGLATLTGLLLRGGGSSSLAPEALDARLEELGASVESHVSATVAALQFSALQPNTAEALAIFHDLLTAPSLRRDRLDWAKRQIQGGIARRNDDPGQILRRELNSLLDGRDTAAGRRPEFASIGPITRSDVEAFYRRYFFPANTVLAFLGDFTTADMKAAVETLFSDWKAKQPPAPDFPKAAGTGSVGAWLAVQPELKETWFGLGQLSVDYRDPDCAALEVLATILAGAPHSRIRRPLGGETRESFHDVRAELLPGLGASGRFLVVGRSASLATGDAIQQVAGEIDRLRTVEAAEEEVQAARESAIVRLGRGLDNKVNALTAAATFAYYGYPAGALEQYAARLAAVTRADILRVARERLKPEQFTIVAVSNLMTFRTPLDPRGSAARTIDLAIPLSTAAPALRSTESSLEEGRKLLRRAQQAAGGAEQLAAVKDMSSTTVYRLADGSDDHESDQWIAPNFLREDGATPRVGRLIRYTDGNSGWVSNGRTSAGLNGTGLKQTRGELVRLFIPMLLSDRAADRVVNAIDEQTIEIVQRDVRIEVEFDAGTGLPVRLLYESPTEKGLPAQVQEDLSDYREVNGLKLPHAIAVRQNGARFAEGTVSEYKFNSGLKLELLQRRP